MKQIVFYSWQSDLPNSSNRGFIQDALENAAKAITADNSIAVEPVVDRDTQGVPGAPDIASTILAKITGADVFVADVSIVGRNETRATPNPNVLIELGYALKALGPERVILVFNRAFGKIEELPFDLRMRRVLTYEMPPTGIPKGPERKSLEKQLDGAIRTALGNQQPASIPALESIEAQSPNRIIVLRRNLEYILGRLDKLQPISTSKGGTIDDFFSALSATQEVVAEFTKIVEAVAVIDDGIAALEVIRWFGQVFERYAKPEGFTGTFSNADEDYFKFLGHELFVTFIGALIREERWGLIETVLARPIPIKYLPREHRSGSVDWRYASEHLPSVLDESTRRRRISLHADILNERHTTGGLAAVMPMEELMAADYFLFLLGELAPDQGPGTFIEWRPWSALYLKQAPLFLRAAERKEAASQLLKIFEISDASEFRRRFVERAGRLKQLFNGGFWTSPVGEEDVKGFGTR